MEDTGVTAQDLRDAFPGRADIVDAVLAITHLPGVADEPYWALVRADPIARQVKLADIGDNTDPDRLALLDPATRRRLQEKYERATRALG